MQYLRLFADASGESHFADVEVPLTLTDFAPPAPPLNLSPFLPAARSGFLGAPAGWSGDYHPTPRRQFIFVLRGIFEGTASDGGVRRLGPGSVLLMEDTTGKGHATRIIGDEDALAAVVQLAD
jgi:hypothetical protein